MLPALNHVPLDQHTFMCYAYPTLHFVLILIMQQVAWAAHGECLEDRSWAAHQNYTEAASAFLAILVPGTVR